MALVENLDAFFADFGVACTLAGVAQVGIFDKAYIESFGMVAGNTPVLLVQDADAPGVAEGTVVVVNSTTYSVAGIEPDGTGLTLLRLEL